MNSLVKSLFGSSNKISPGGPNKKIIVDFEDESEDEIEIENESFLGEVKYSNGDMSINVVDARKFVISNKNWIFNREVNNEHVSNLKRELLKANSPHLIGTFKLVVEKKSSPLVARIIDGQHRFMAIQQIMDTDTKFNLDIVLEVYYVNDINGPDVWLLFQKANNVLNVQEVDKIVSSASYIVTELSNKFSHNIREPKGKTGRINFPSINSRLLFEKLKKSDIFDYKSKEEVFNLIIEKNLELSKKDVKDYITIFGKEKFEKAYKKCYKDGCYLGLNEKFTWFNEIEVRCKLNC